MHGQKKRRKRSLTGTVTVGGFDLCWELRSEPQHSTEHGKEGMSFEVRRTDGAFRGLILEYPFPKKNMRIDGQIYQVSAFLPIRPKFSPKTIEADIQRAIVAGWNPDSRGKDFVFQVPEDSK